MIRIDPTAYGLDVNVDEFRDYIVTWWNGWKPARPYDPCGLDEFFLRATTHYLPFVEYIRSKIGYAIPDYIIGAALIQNRKKGTARVKPYKR